MKNTFLESLGSLKARTENPWVFLIGAMAGKMHFTESSEKDDGPLTHLGSGQTPVSKGLSEGYSPDDIAHFYIARELGTSWLAHLKIAFNEFCHDIQFEERYAGPEIYCCNNLTKEKGKTHE